MLLWTIKKDEHLPRQSVKELGRLHLQKYDSYNVVYCSWLLSRNRSRKSKTLPKKTLQHGVGALLVIPQDPGHSNSAYGFMWVHSAALLCSQVSLLHMPGHGGDGAVCLCLCPACRQCEHLNLTLKSSEASSFRFNFSILRSSLNFALEHKATTFSSSRAQKQYFHYKPTLFQAV